MNIRLNIIDGLFLYFIIFKTETIYLRNKFNSVLEGFVNYMLIGINKFGI